MSTTTKLILYDGTLSINASQYQSVVNTLQYLSFTRPNTAYSINKLAQYFHTPSEAHWSVAKRLLRYLKTNINFGLSLKC